MTAASPSEAELGRAFGGVVLSNSLRAGPASCDASGRRHVFVPHVNDGAARYAIDVEDRRTSPPDHLRRRLDPDDTGEALRIWTEIEVVAKILAEPAQLVLNRFVKSGKLYDKQLADIEIVRLDTAGHWVAVGRQERV